MTTLPHSQHLVRKKGYTPHYVQAHINLFQPEMHDSTCELIEVGFGISDSQLSPDPAFPDARVCGWKEVVRVPQPFPSPHG